MTQTQGDPRLIMTQNGTHLQFVGGQPLMDRGLENLVLISLFTKRGWCGNKLMKVGIGSDFEDACNEPITLQSLNKARMAAEKALTNPAFGSVQVEVTNPSGIQRRIRILIAPPGENPQELILLKSGENWLQQAKSPAYKEIRSERWRKPLMGEDGLILHDGYPLEF